MPPLPTTLSLSETRLRGVLELSHEDWRAWLAEHGEKPFRARQIRSWVLERGVDSFEQMTDLPLALRSALAESLMPLSSRVVQHLEAEDGTHKLLLELRDGRIVECVLIQEDERRTACISTQVGCGMGCVFCASGLEGLDRNLTASEILEQLVHLRKLPSADLGAVPARHRASAERKQEGASFGRLTHIVVMGMGEPLANLDNLLAALETVTAKDGLGLGARHITVSTVGLPAKIRKLAESGKQYHLAVSLHAPNEEIRRRIVPTTDQTGLQAILEAADYYFTQTGRQVTFEYVLLAGINDSPAHAAELGRLLCGRQAHVNVIPFNEVEGLPYRQPGSDTLAAFLQPLKRQGISVKVRKRKGSRIQAACGQLRRQAQTSQTMSTER